MGMFDQTQHEVGDEVVCVLPIRDGGFLRKGELYTITHGNYGRIFQEDYVDVVGSEGGKASGVYANRFKKMEETSKKGGGR